MPVLIGRRNDRVVIPILGVAIGVLRIAGRSVKLSVKVPVTAQVHRQEVAARTAKERVHGYSK